MTSFATDLSPFPSGVTVKNSQIDPDSINVRKVVADYVGTPAENVSQELVDLAVTELGLDQPEAYIFQVVMGEEEDDVMVLFADEPAVDAVLGAYTVGGRVARF